MSGAVDTLNLALRAGLVALLLLTAALLLRDHRRSLAARLGAAFAVGVAAHALCSMPGFSAWPAAWRAPLQALAAGNAVVFWLFARALFDDGLRWRPADAAWWALLAALAFVDCAGWLPAGWAPGPAFWHTLGLVITLATLGFALAAGAQALSSWRADLVEGRRLLRGFIVGAGATYTLLFALGNLSGLRRLPGAATAAGLADALLLAAITLVVLWRLLGIGATLLFPDDLAPAARPAQPEAPPVPPLAAVPAGPDPQEQRLIAALERQMDVERVYREDGLTIGALAARLGVPEYRLRRLINQRLGQRNFNAWLNGYRIAEVKAALADPAQAEVPVLTLAMDAGFTSLGPFNRAFKAETGMTPTEYRRTVATAPPPSAPSAHGSARCAGAGAPSARG